jgi:ribosomal protein L23
MRAPELIIKRPLLTEKGTTLKETGGSPTRAWTPSRSPPSCSFEVPATPTKVEIRTAVREAWNVRVVKVRTAGRCGQGKRMVRFVGAARLLKRRCDPPGAPAKRSSSSREV